MKPMIGHQGSGAPSYVRIKCFINIVPLMHKAYI